MAPSRLDWAARLTREVCERFLKPLQTAAGGVANSRINLASAG